MTIAQIGVPIAFAALVGAAWWSRRRMPSPTGARDAWAFAPLDAAGQPYPLARHRGEALLIVNTASRCGFTPQYAGLAELHRRFAARGLTVIGVPANDFLWQAPGDATAIGACALRFGASFPLLGKARVVGRRRIPLYRWLTAESSAPGAIRWNFTKFLIGRDGRVRARFGPRIEPLAPELIAAIETALAEPAPTADRTGDAR